MNILCAISWRALDHWPAALALLVIAGVGLFVLYPPQIRSMGVRWRWLMPLPRAMALLAMSLSVLRPVLVRDRTVQEEGAVLVLLDRSASMSVADRVISTNPAERRRSIGQIVALAHGLGKLPAGARPPSTAGTSQAVVKLELLADEIARARREADYARLSARDPREAEANLDALLREMSTAASSAQASAAKSGQSALAALLAKFSRNPKPEERDAFLKAIPRRMDDLRAEADRIQDALDERLYDQNPAVRSACDQLSRMSRFDLCWDAISAGNGLLANLDRQAPVLGFAIGDSPRSIPLKYSGQPLANPPGEARGATSDLSGDIQRILQQLGRQPVQAIVLFSDGREVAAAPSAGPISTGGVPIFTIAAASERVRDLAITRLDVPASAYIDEEIIARASATVVRIDPGQFAGQATLSAGDDVMMAGTPLLVRDRKLDTIEFPPIRLHTPGAQRLIVNLPAQGDELSYENNRAEAWIKVIAQRLRVLSVTSAPTWDFRYMRDALSRRPWIDWRGAVVVPGVSSLAVTARDILQQDVVILNDVARESLTLEQWDAVGELVKQRGGSVIIIPGIHHPSQQWSGHVIGDLLPYPMRYRPAWRVWPGQFPHYRLIPAADAQDLTALRMDSSADASRRRWEELPAFYRYLAIPDLKPNAKALLVERETGQPILTEGRFGAGRVFFLAMAETWRWRDRIGSRDQDRFFLQLIRHAAEEPYTLTSGALSLDVDKVSAEPGETLRVRARLAGSGSFPPRLDLFVMKDDSLVRTISLEPASPRNDGRYTTLLSGLAEELYELRIFGPGGGEGPDELRLPLRIARGNQAELANLSGDRALLQRLADTSGGKSLAMSQLASLPRLLSDARLRQPRTVEFRLWDSGYLFIFVLSCFTLEWALRKRMGLA